MRKPFDMILESVSNNLDKDIENANKNIDFLQNYLIWMIGFSTGALYLLASDFGSFKDVFSFWTIKSIIISLALSITSGIVSRFTLFLFQSEMNTNSFYIKGAVSSSPNLKVDFADVSEETDAGKIANLLKYDFDEDENEAMSIYNNGDNKDKDFILNFLKRKYKDLASWSVVDYEIGMNYVEDVFKKAYGYNDKELAKLKVSFNIRTYRNWAFISLFVSGLLFIVSLFIIMIAY